jgi:hypothetical protein
MGVKIRKCYPTQKQRKHPVKYGGAGSWYFCWWHSTSGSVPNQEHFFRALGGSVRDLRARKVTPRRAPISPPSRLIKNHSSNHDARYNDFAGLKRQRALQGCNHAVG